MERIAMYLRLSKEDQHAEDESNSISNQRDLIHSYINKDRNLSRQEIIEIKDDGYSGKSLNRPGMQQLLTLIKQRQVSCIIVKDMSRFSRDYLVLGQYTEQIFPFMGIRFIAINDNYDSANCTGGLAEIDVSFKALLYDFYSEDLSQKVKSALTVRKQDGKFMNVYAPYGYRKCEDNHNKLEIEPQGAEVIKNIFVDYSNGKSMYDIARKLHYEQIPTPMAYIRKRDGRNYFKKDMGDGYWTTSAVSRILHNHIYGGYATYHKYHGKSIGVGCGVPYPKDTWQYLPDTFPEIVDKNIYEKVQRRLACNSKRQQKNEAGLFKGKVRCGNCGYALSYSHAGRIKLACKHKYYIDDGNKCVTSVREENLKTVVLQLVQEKIKNRIAMDDLIKKNQLESQAKIANAKRKLHSLEESYDKIEADLFNAYQSYREGNISKETYLEQKDTSEKILAGMKTNLQKQRQAVDTLERNQAFPVGWQVDSSYLQVQQLDREIIELLIKKITVYHDGRLDIEWNFNNEI